MARQETETSPAAAAASAEEMATMTRSSSRKSVSLALPYPSERQKLKRVPNEFASQRLHSIKRPPRAGVSPVGRQSQKSHEYINNGEGEHEIST